ncbi:PaaI family thioesterase [Parvibaculum sp.]|uniref:PaaI family thioesterase n=1 Tax=Parvibaculum sp. TaxID=2024848 RepID=UPI00320F1AC9
MNQRKANKNKEARVADLSPIMSVEELDRFMDVAFPQMHEGGRLNVIEEVGPGTARLRLRYSDRNLRPGGTISGPAMMALADYAMYAVVLAHIGPVALAVTTNLSINFLRKPGPDDIIAEAKLLKLGRRLAVGDVLMWQEGLDGPVAHVTSTYSIPPDR